MRKLFCTVFLLWQWSDSDDIYAIMKSMIIFKKLTRYVKNIFNLDLHTLSANNQRDWRQFIDDNESNYCPGVRYFVNMLYKKIQVLKKVNKNSTDCLPWTISDNLASFFMWLTERKERGMQYIILSDEWIRKRNQKAISSYCHIISQGRSYQIFSILIKMCSLLNETRILS